MTARAEDSGLGSAFGRGEPLGLIAGNGRLPFYVVEAARKRGLALVIVAHRGETSPELDTLAPGAVTWVPVGALGKIARALKAGGARRAIMAGGLGKAKLLRDFRPDLAAMALLLKVRSRDDDTLLRALADWFTGEGIEIVDAAPLIPELYAPAGVLGRRKPDAGERADMEHGWRLAKALGALDVGQSVAVKKGATVAVEAVEGTDALIRRAGELAGHGFVLVKTSKPEQDLRFDVPTVGPGTLAALAEAGGTALAVEAGRTLLIEREEMIRLADQHHIALLGVAS